MNRRSFLSLFGVTAATIAADPEALLWTPGKLINIPSIIKPRGNQIVPWRVVSERFLHILQSQINQSLSLQAEITEAGMNIRRPLHGSQFKSPVSGLNRPCLFPGSPASTVIS